MNQFSWQNLNEMGEFSGWGDIAMNEQRGNRRERSSAGMTHDASAASHDNKRFKEDGSHFSTRNWHNNDDVYGPRQLNNWNDVVEEDQGDISWFIEENKRLAEQYGTFVQVKPVKDHPERVEYYCELCFAMMNAKKSLDIHCSGMKHLKKTKMWEQLKGIGNSTISKGQASDPPASLPPPTNHRYQAQGREDPPEPRRYQHMREAPEPPRFLSTRGENPDTSRFQSERGQNPDSPGSRPPSAPYRDSDRHQSYKSSRWGSPVGDRYDDPYNSRSLDRGEYSRREVSRSPLYYRRGGEDSYHPTCLGRRTSPVPGVGPTSRESLSKGPTGSLLKRMADCSVKSDPDALLAIEVISLLFKSLKEFHQRRGSQNAVRVVCEAEIKFNILKELQNVTPRGGSNY
ncbi:hypothetical protein OTU49_004859 [Cherax quadricarinatus]|uniref:Uncharacterized protein n=1 Tax=Cherax quadricarinatus TaxID=27406 RepID=A0AAW0WX03_CHEQU|nr:uncharacterized protein LOC128697587 isoform X2 [Cherax quadricarinatus]